MKRLTEFVNVWTINWTLREYFTEIKKETQEIQGHTNYTFGNVIQTKFCQSKITDLNYSYNKIEMYKTVNHFLISKIIAKGDILDSFKKCAFQDSIFLAGTKKIKILLEWCSESESGVRKQMVPLVPVMKMLSHLRSLWMIGGVLECRYCKPFRIWRPQFRSSFADRLVNFAM